MGTHAGWVVFIPIFDCTLTLLMGGLYYLKPAPWGPMTRSITVEVSIHYSRSTAFPILTAGQTWSSILSIWKHEILITHKSAGDEITVSLSGDVFARVVKHVISQIERR